jgi:hypothetical protein
MSGYAGGKWEHDGRDVMGCDGPYPAICSCDGFKNTAIANAARIVQCVNAHDELVEALEDCESALHRAYKVTGLPHDRTDEHPAAIRAHALLARIGGGK